jgi:hypothetical protein
MMVDKLFFSLGLTAFAIAGSAAVAALWSENDARWLVIVLGFIFYAMIALLFVKVWRDE